MLICGFFVCSLSYKDINYYYLKNFLFYIGVYLINNAVLVSGEQQSDSVTHIHVSILFQILFPFRLLQNIVQSSLCYTVGSCWLSILNIAVCTCQSQTPNGPWKLLFFSLSCEPACLLASGNIPSPLTQSG